MNRRTSNLEPVPAESAKRWQSPAGGTTPRRETHCPLATESAQRWQFPASSTATPRRVTQWPLAAWIVAAAAVAGLLEVVVSSRHLTRETA